MPLETYWAKRDFAVTAEPRGETGTTGDGRSFVIQKHAASRLHYDFRLELEGTMKSWAVPKGPSYDPNDKRMAMPTEDHPIAYNRFEGTIPAGNYGAGTVMVWDQGEYEDLTGNPAAAFHQGKMHIIMRGKKLKGEGVSNCIQI